MKDILLYIGNGDYWWISVITFSVIVSISGLMGALNGWKAALFFLVWNVVTLIIGIFMTSPILKLLENKVDLSNLPISIANANPYIGPLILFIIILISNFLAFIIYLFIRKFLKKSMKENKDSGKSNIFNRLIGSGVGVIAGLPLAAIMTNYASLTTTDNGFTQFNGAILRGITGSKFKGFDKTDKNSIKSIIEMIDDKSQFEKFTKLFDGSSKGGKPEVDFGTAEGEKVKKKIENILANPTLLKMFDPSKIDAIKELEEAPKASSITENLDVKINVPKSSVPLILEKLKLIFSGSAEELKTLYGHLFSTI